MKDKIMLFVIGVLLGAVIATGAFYIYTITTKSCDCSFNNIGMNGGQPPEMPNEQNSKNGQFPEKSSNENGEPPVKFDENNSQNSSN